MIDLFKRSFFITLASKDGEDKNYDAYRAYSGVDAFKIAIEWCSKQKADWYVIDIKRI